MNQQLRLFVESTALAVRACAWLASLVAVLVLAACTTPSFPPAPGDASSADYNYHIGPSDVVNVIVWRNPELSMSVPVRPDGKITTPLVDDLAALGKTPTELARDMEKALGKYIRDPVVTVIVTNFVGPASEQIRVIGEAAKPQALAFRQRHDGARRDDRGRRTDRFRRRQRGAHLPRRRRRQALQRAACATWSSAATSRANVDMRPGDILIIPQSWF